MKTGKVADMLGVDQKTILNWTDRPEFSEFFSPEAKGLGRSMGRDFTEAEIVVLNTIHTERQKNTDWTDIGRLLGEGVRDTNLPPSALTVDSPAPLVQYGKLQQLQVQVDLLEKENSHLRDEMRELREAYQQLQQRQNTDMERLLKQKQEEMERLLKESTHREGELREQIGELKAMLRIRKEDGGDE
jgi:DNA-binding transcriptional MerR regulator